MPAALLLALAAPAQGAAAADTDGDGTGGERRASLEWGACDDLTAERVEETGADCAELEVPLETARSDGAGARAAETVRLALSRVPARAADGEAADASRVLLVNPGGPGSAGREWALRIAEQLPDDLREQYDVVGFDPRGTGASTPAVTCDESYFDPVRPDTVPASRADERALLERTRAYAEACGEKNAELLDHMRTEDSAHDIDRIRRALGENTIDYLGYSYGTYLGAAYATLYPERAGRLVLDSVVHPGRPWYESNLRQSRALDDALRNFFDWTGRHHDVYGLGADAEAVEETYFRVRGELAEEPAGDVVGPTEYENAFISAAYAAAVWPRLAEALSDHVSGEDEAALVDASERFGEGPSDEPGYGAYLATQCTDSPWPTAWPVWRDAAERSAAEAPATGWNNIWYNAPCAAWPAEAGAWLNVGAAGNERGAGDRGPLLVHATEDGPTPVEGAYALRGRFPGARLVIEDGGLSHGVSLAGNTCVDEAVADYLREGVLPYRAAGRAADLVCEAGPEPEAKLPQSAAEVDREERVRLIGP
ncbi:alpha/beta hydrolase [Nocardiopsis sp. LSu2-4]|uniref:Alpha/beta hydrolase n=1 Tax=Nocardiopsis suaedae TaxID=3018444 RepID=A0ABT4TNT7_9ACTN|nr:alpha/beta hydrolase [Nocardiopsis suaedae]MDA2806362.1 alpha/beta hydrolase [Nocardiopsis suaedae]